MGNWVIKKNIPYEGISETYCVNAEEVKEYLDVQSGLEMEDITIEPASPVSYSAYSFLEAMENGES